MKLPVAWLKEYVDPGMPAEKLAERLTMSGSKVESVEVCGADAVIDIEVTTNRPDCLSVIGLAREVSAFTGRPVRVPAAYRGAEKSVKSAAFTVEVRDKKACPRYTARLLRNVHVAPAPDKARRFLELMGTRPVSNVVDATNWVLFESGQPLHAFDFDKLSGGKIVVRRSVKGEKFTGIDGIEHELDGETLVIADAARPVAIAGVMGGKLTEVTPSTKNVLLESAYFDPALVRRAARKYKTATESSYRFERRVNPDGVAAASRQAAWLIAEWAGGIDASGLLDLNFIPRAKALRVALSFEKLDAVLGARVKPSRAVQILKSLSLEPKATAKAVSVPESAARADIRLPEDLVEEILRVEGFEKIPAALPPTRHAAASAARRARVPELQRFMAASGFSEIITYSLLSRKAIEDSGFPVESFAKIANPVSAEQEYLRRLLLPGALGAVAYNAHRKATSLKIFETGRRYDSSSGREEAALSIAFWGPYEENWSRKSEGSFYDAKGAVENVMTSFFKTGPVTWKPESDPGPAMEYGATAHWQGGGVPAFAGSVKPEVLKRWDIPGAVYYAEIALDKLLEWAPPVPRAAMLPKHPSVRRDVAFVADKNVSTEELGAAMAEAGAPHLREVRLFDEYKGKGIPEGRRSLAFSLTYQKEGTFTDEEIGDLQKRVGEALKSRFRVEFR